MSEDIKRALTLGGGGLVVAVVVGGGWMWWSEGQRRDALSGELSTWTDAVGAYETCMVGEGPADAERLLLSQAVERARDVRCHAEHLAALSWSEDEAAEPLKTAVGALDHGEPANPRISELDADQTCKQLAAVHTALQELRLSLDLEAGSGPSDCALELTPWPLLSQPPADPAVPGIRKGALRRVALRGDRVYAGYRMARQGVLAWKVGEADWAVVPSELQLEGVYWGGEKPWGVVSDPDAPAGMIRYRALAWTGTEWSLRAALPEGMVPYSADGPGGDYAVGGSTWMVPVRSLRESAIAVLPLTDEGRTVGEPLTLMPQEAAQQPALHFSEDGVLNGMVLTDDPGGFTFFASHISPGAEREVTSRVFLPVDVPDPLQSKEITICGDGEHRYALAGSRWLLRGSDGGADWLLHHTFEAPMRRAELACHGDQVAILADQDGTREAVPLHYAVCGAAGCSEPIALGEQQADGRGLVFDDDGPRLLSAMLGHAVVFRDQDGEPVPEHIYSAAERADDALPVVVADGRMFAVRAAE